MAALLLHFGVVQKSLDRSEKTLIHNLAQFVHCLAQGKVGSGFDVSSAVWGSHRYKRFNPSILTPLMVSEHTQESFHMLIYLFFFFVGRKCKSKSIMSSIRRK